MKKKELYAAPEVEVLELHLEAGILTPSQFDSNQLPAWGDGGDL